MRYVVFMHEDKSSQELVHVVNDVVDEVKWWAI